MSVYHQRIAPVIIAATLGLLAAGPGLAQDKMVLNMQSGYPGSLSIFGDTATRFTELVGKMSAGNIEIRFQEPNALVPSPEIFDAVGARRIEMGFSWNGYQAGKIPAILAFNAIPFGPSHDVLMAWLMEGGGNDIIDELYAPFNVKSIPCGIVLAEASGWFREEITSPEQLRGMKIRYVGLAAEVMSKLGASPTLVPGNEIFTSLERGVLDATEFSLPSIDKNLGFYKVAKHYYFPGWHQPSSVQELIVNLDLWNEMSESQQYIIKTACGESVRYMIGKGLAEQADAMSFFREQGVSIHTWSDEMLAAFRQASEEVLAERSAKDPEFKRALDSLNAFDAGVKAWSDIAILSE